MDTSYELRIGKFSNEIRTRRAKENGCIEIKDETIQQIPCIHIFQENNINRKFQHYLKKVLTLSKDRLDRHMHGEVGILIDKGDLLSDTNPIKATMYGEYHSVVTNVDYQNAVANALGSTLAFIHNHPNNSSFSYMDIKTFTNTASISTIVAVGNAGKIFVINKTSQYDCKGILSFMDNTAIKFAQKDNNRYDFKAYQDAAATELLKNYKQYGMEYIVGGKTK